MNRISERGRWWAKEDALPAARDRDRSRGPSQGPEGEVWKRGPGSGDTAARRAVTVPEAEGRAANQDAGGGRDRAHCYAPRTL